MLKATGLLAAALLLVSSGAAYSRSQAHPTTLVWAKGEIVAFAQDGDQIAWASVPGALHRACEGEVRIRLLGKHQQKLVSCENYEDAFFGDNLGNPIGFSLAGRRALWKAVYCGNNCYQQLETVSYSTGTKALLKEELVWEDYGLGGGDDITAIAGDSSTLVYGVATPVYSGDCGADSDGICTLTMHGYIKRVIGTRTVKVLGVPPPAMLAASGRRIALVVAETVRSSDGELAPMPGSPAHAVVIDAVTGASVGSFSPAGKPLALAFAPSVVAVLESTAGETQIEFRTAAGALLRTVAVPAKATGLSTTNKRAVFAVGKSIRTVGVRTGSVRQIATVKAMPIGLSIEGKRVAWAENVKIHGVLRGRIRAITIR